MKKILVLLLCSGLCGCAANSGVVPIGQDTFMVSRQAATGFSGSGTLKAKALQEASQFCEKQGKKLQVVSTSEASPPYILTNFPKAEVQFMCLDVNDPQFQRTRLEKSPDMVIKRDDTVKADVDVRTKEESNKSPDLYTELVKLEDLRKKNILTEAEFQAQKKLLLEEQK
ncbi:MAG: SHOCT domain-containing protein [Candidatus Omnitrophota bacterium]